jgi:hypothetical protein
MEGPIEIEADIVCRPGLAQRIAEPDQSLNGADVEGEAGCHDHQEDGAERNHEDTLLSLASAGGMSLEGGSAKMAKQHTWPKPHAASPSLDAGRALSDSPFDKMERGNDSAAESWGIEDSEPAAVPHTNRPWLRQHAASASWHGSVSFDVPSQSKKSHMSSFFSAFNGKNSNQEDMSSRKATRAASRTDSVKGSDKGMSLAKMAGRKLFATFDLHAPTQTSPTASGRSAGIQPKENRRILGILAHTMQDEEITRMLMDCDGGEGRNQFEQQSTGISSMEDGIGNRLFCGQKLKAPLVSMRRTKASI